MEDAFEGQRATCTVHTNERHVALLRPILPRTHGNSGTCGGLKVTEREMVSQARILGVLTVIVALATGDAAFGDALPIPPDVAAQQTRGKTVYARSCAACHGANLQGGSGTALTPLSKLKTVPAKASAADLARRIRDTMPKNDPGTLSSQASLDVTAFILARGVAAPTEPLTPTSAPKMPIPRR